MLRLISMLAALWLSGPAFPQAATTNPAVLQVQLLAPQLLAFAGSTANFESLVNGLTQGTPVTLTSVGADGTTQIVTFTTGTTVTAGDAARLLESARQALIARGIGAPNAQQVAVALMGGALPTALGTTQVTGVVSGNAGATPVEVRAQSAAAPSPLGTVTAAGLQALQDALTRNTAVTIPGANGNVTFNAPGRALSALEASQALQLANLALAQQGIVNPTAEQLRAALLGGSVTTAAGAVALQGIVQSQVRNTSDSVLFGTSNSPVIGTSDVSPAAGSPVVPGTASAPAAGTPVLPGTASAPAAGTPVVPGAAAGAAAPAAAFSGASPGSAAAGGTAAGPAAAPRRFGAGR